ncbi:hypothetical protein CYLTODRAFT_443063 [Cylindrobasidium torrendii FP15055 ss-10]|uniref:Wax synthase domain-containing protein n=1 Tax=Cylindrobasidium torrendii FP15055 ss-10 TaxID=1314674 RepID=A0A0D7BFC4_9AGAR|nr:hypothetical protein CYLTODRAFT_443063 [Cylindrobasidium torrendii FP15055 ss-10]
MSPCERGWFASSAGHVSLSDGWEGYALYLPPFVLYFIAAVLVTLPNTRIYRFALLPLMYYTAYRDIMYLDFSGGNPQNEGMNAVHVPQNLATGMTLRMTGWAFERRTLVRVGKKRTGPRSTADILWDAADLFGNVSGIGWNYSGRPEHDGRKLTRISFSAQRFGLYVANALIYEGAMFLQVFVHRHPDSLPYYQRRVVEAVLVPTVVYSLTASNYMLSSIIGVVLIRQDPEQWPSPYRSLHKARSLTTFWGRGWQQVMRDICTRMGGVPLGYLFGRPGYVMGTFLLSGLWHDSSFWASNRPRGLCYTTTPFFVLSGVGVMIEVYYQRVTGRKVDGALGVVWLVGWSLASLLLTMSSECMWEMGRAGAGEVLPPHLTLVQSYLDWRSGKSA